MRRWLQSIRHLRRSPGNALAVVAILGLGIGANTAVFSVVDSTLLKPLPYPAPDRLVWVLETNPSRSERESLIAPARLADWNRMSRAFDGLAGSYSENETEVSGDKPERLAARRVSPGYFAVFGTRPLLGRTFTHNEEAANGPLAAVLSFNFWERRFHRSPRAIGQKLILAGKSCTITGVMPRGFSAAKIDLWLPAQLDPWLMRQRDARFYSGVGRMKPRVTLAQAREDLARMQRELGRQYPKTDRGWSATAGDLKERQVGDSRKTLLFIFGAVALLFAIAVANVAALMLTQFQRRGRELAIRSSLGASRRQILGTLMGEAVLLAMTGTVAGCLFARWLLEVFRQTLAVLPAAGGVSLDWRAFLFAGAAGALAVALFGALPALPATGTNPALLLAEAGRGGSASRYRWQRTLLAAQTALTVLLLASSGLLLASFRNLEKVAPGFEPDRAVTFHLSAAWDEDRTRVGEMQENLLDALERAPGVEHAGFANFLPASMATLRYPILFEGTTQGKEQEPIVAGERSISRGYLAALGAPLLAGSDCPDLRALKSGTPKALVNRRMAERYGRSLIGEHFRFQQDNGGLATEIIGVVGDIHEDSLQLPPSPYVYVCIVPGGWPDPEYVVRTRGNPKNLLAMIPSIAQKVDPTRAVFGRRTLDRVLEETLDQPRLHAHVVSAFALAALLMACSGVYGLVMLVVNSRRREIGVRIALGAQPRQIIREVVSGVGQSVAAGAAAGLLLTWAANRVLRSVLFGVAPLDPIPLSGALILFAAAAMLAAAGPARRAAHTDPLAVIRNE